MRLLTLIISMLIISQTAKAAFMMCTYQAEPCDHYGEHYICSLTGWTGPNQPEHCSDHDESTFPVHPLPNHPVPVTHPPQPAYDSCVEQCGRPCMAQPVFCGQW